LHQACRCCMLPAMKAALLALSLALLSPALLAAEKLSVISFSTILTEVAEKVGQDHVQVIGLIKPGVDPHDFEPSPADLKRVSTAKLVLLSAKHMEGYVGKLKQTAGSTVRVVEVGDQFPSLKMKAEDDHDHDKEAEKHAHGKPGKDGMVEDPHWWHSLDNVRRATKVLQDELTRLEPGAKAEFAANAAAYGKELDALENWARGEIAKIPRNQRKLVTSHDAFQYFAKAFGFSVHPIEGVTSEDQPSSRAVAELISEIKKEKVKAIFLESIENPKVTQEITKETGVKIGGTLYADGLGDGKAGTYDGMYRHNVSTIVEALK
jgi:zinc/manganese transport system substrate-binding protein